MLRASLRKIKSAPKHKKLWLGVRVLFTAAVGGILFLMIYHPSDAQKPVVLHLKQGDYVLEVVSTPKDQAEGLSNRPDLGRQSGMLFKFPSATEQCFWMKDMRFPLDIIWVDGWHTVTHIEHNLSPSTYPQSYCADAADVLELNAGEADRNDIVVGQTLKY
jgi:uncharacterized membrane protein (UPF0127 family)